MNAFAAAAAVLCADVNLGVDAIYRPASAPQRTVRAIRSRAVQAEFGGGGVGALLGEELAHVAASDMAVEPRRGDTMEFPTEAWTTFRVDRAELDETGAMWRLVLATALP